MSRMIVVEQIERKIYFVRGMKVMLDKDLALLYGVKAFRLREQVKRNRGRFPADFMFQLNDKEIDFIEFRGHVPN
ncbi:MAG: ORF6N domain-containing protein [Candidatus Omnitrophica bacterium]|nr:ORF6N domain-containing protein [Candidatus Omnitrophota bacterium]